MIDRRAPMQTFAAVVSAVLTQSAGSASVAVRARMTINGCEKPVEVCGFSFIGALKPGDVVVVEGYQTALRTYSACRIKGFESKTQTRAFRLEHYVPQMVRAN